METIIISREWTTHSLTFRAGDKLVRLQGGGVRRIVEDENGNTSTTPINFIGETIWREALKREKR